MPLLLNRRLGEAVLLRDEIKGEVICVVTVSELLPNGVVRLSFEADKSISISRDNMKKGKGDKDAKEINGRANQIRPLVRDVDGNR